MPKYANYAELAAALKWTVSRKTSDVVLLEDPNQSILPFKE